MKATRTWIAAAVTGLLACDAPARPELENARVTFDVRALASDIVSVLASARLTIEADGKSSTLTTAVGPSDSVIGFDVDVPEGSARFLLDVLSNNQTVLYHADQDATIDRDGFTVALVPVPVGPVLVVSPKNPAFVFFSTGAERLAVTAFQVRNAGIGQLRWNLEKAAPDTVRLCSMSGQRDCFLQQVWNPPVVQDTVAIAFLRPAGVPGGNRTISFTSNVGRATFTVTVP